MTSEEKLEKAMSLLSRAVGYDAIPPDTDWWREYFELNGEHVFLGGGSYIPTEEYEQLSNERKPFYEEVNKPISS